MDMKKIYADNSSTSFPKAAGVSQAVKDFIDNAGCNINRGGYKSSYDVALDVLACRQLLAKLFKAASPRNVIFTPGVTYSLNMILRGFLQAGDHVVTTSMEHNGLMRPLHDLAQAGVAYDIAPCAPDGSLEPARFEELLKSNTKAVVLTHASNVCGTILPIYDIADICAARGVKIIVDAAQTAGVLDIDASRLDALAFTAHKGLLAPQGLGGFVIKDDFARLVKPVITGGTGSSSHELAQPDFLPDKFESGTMNIPAIMGLKAALEYIDSVGVERIFEKEMQLTKSFMDGLGGMDGVEIIGKKGIEGRIAVVSLDFKHMDNADVAAQLDAEYGIMTRCGLHCSPNSHKTLGTYPRGTVRFSFGHLNTLEEIEHIIFALKEVLAHGL